MRWPFLSSGRVVDADTEDWILETSRWLIDQFGGPTWLTARSLVLPTTEFFERRDDSGEERAARVFRAVKRHAGMDDWNCTLVAHDGAPVGDLGGVAYQVHVQTNPAGAFTHDGDTPVISYSIDLEDDPTALIATFAHELAHLRLSVVEEAAPGGWDLEELATDVAAVMMGFGVFMANSAFSISKSSDFDRQSWSMKRQGYLSENSLTFALAVFLAMKNEPMDYAAKYLKQHLAKVLGKASKRIEHHELLNKE